MPGFYGLPLYMIPPQSKRGDYMLDFTSRSATQTRSGSSGSKEDDPKMLPADRDAYLMAKMQLDSQEAAIVTDMQEKIGSGIYESTEQYLTANPQIQKTYYAIQQGKRELAMAGAQAEHRATYYGKAVESDNFRQNSDRFVTDADGMVTIKTANGIARKHISAITGQDIPVTYSDMAALQLVRSNFFTKDNTIGYRNDNMFVDSPQDIQDPGEYLRSEYKALKDAMEALPLSKGDFELLEQQAKRNDDVGADAKRTLARIRENLPAIATYDYSDIDLSEIKAQSYEGLYSRVLDAFMSRGPENARRGMMQGYLEARQMNPNITYGQYIDWVGKSAANLTNEGLPNSGMGSVTGKVTSKPDAAMERTTEQRNMLLDHNNMETMPYTFGNLEKLYEEQNLGAYMSEQVKGDNSQQVQIARISADSQDVFHKLYSGQRLRTGTTAMLPGGIPIKDSQKGSIIIGDVFAKYNALLNTEQGSAREGVMVEVFIPKSVAKEITTMVKTPEGGERELSLKKFYKKHTEDAETYSKEEVMGLLVGYGVSPSKVALDSENYYRFVVPYFDSAHLKMTGPTVRGPYTR